ncbi:hypothetical protein SAMN04488090_2011 [Siphonobacter aquaeclarae]|uniref:Uncharacterized protein n=1 Tax=Siphonobacter aquaeclarae TaxID=563176 RepID=A0A1G9NHL4_9BACT|nr:hypothetical protein SAMN04488090_2011 [Siphonobacter aquaeclarae]
MNYKILETLADISYYAGLEGYYSGDSRADISNFICWAREFEKIHQDTDWDVSNYMLAIEEYANIKITSKIQP